MIWIITRWWTTLAIHQTVENQRLCICQKFQCYVSCQSITGGKNQTLFWMKLQEGSVFFPTEEECLICCYILESRSTNHEAYLPLSLPALHSSIYLDKIYWTIILTMLFLLLFFLSSYSCYYGCNFIHSLSFRCFHGQSQPFLPFSSSSDSFHKRLIPVQRSTYQKSQWNRTWPV